jgi:signal transduction histidine kinase
MEYRLRRQEGQFRWVLDKGVPMFDRNGSFTGYIGSCIDITEQKVAHEALSNMSRKLIEAHEEVRTWIARELHDDINQRLALTAANLDHLRHQLPGDPLVLRQLLEKLHENVSDIGNDVQALSRRLHSSRLEYLGLAAAASTFCRDVAERQDLEITFHSDKVPKNIPKDVALSLFRVLQEAVQNAIKHSGSRHLGVSVEGAANSIELKVQDFGVGFEPEAITAGNGLGLISMKERLKMVQGELAIESQPSRGTLVRAVVPFDAGDLTTGV